MSEHRAPYVVGPIGPLVVTLPTGEQPTLPGGELVTEIRVVPQRSLAVTVDHARGRTVLLPGESAVFVAVPLREAIDPDDDVPVGFVPQGASS